MNKALKHGVSIVICCYNSSSRLPDAFKYLLKQEVPSDILWEVIVVDNASTDNTSHIARSFWPDDAQTQLRIVNEPNPGLSHARKRGFMEAQYEIISFLDDDNWAAPNWVSLVSEIMTAHPDVGACGGRTVAKIYGSAPSWFTEYSSGYVIGRQFNKTGDITWNKGWLWGAGLTIRKKAWEELNQTGFQSILSGRTGNKISSGEDVELCYALRLAGWRLWYSDDLVIQHYIPFERLTIDYLSKLEFGFGAQTVGFDPYNFYVSHTHAEIKTIFGKIWLRKLFREFYICFFRDCSFWKKWIGRPKSIFNHRMLWLHHWGRINALWKARGKYDIQVNSFDQNRWIRIARLTSIYLHQNPEFGDSENPHRISNPLVTVLICNYNYGHYLGETIESLLTQTWKNLEIIVVDDGSTDESLTVLNHYVTRVRIIRKENGGQASAFNLGVAEAKGKFICFLDSDDICLPDKISRIVKKYKEAPWGLVCHDLELINDTGNSLKTTWSHYAGVNMVEGPPIDVVIKNNYGWIFSPTSGMSIPKKLADKIFPLPSDKWKISADEPMAFSAACLSSVGIIPGTLGCYRLHSKNLFANFHDDMDARKIAFITHTTKRYFFCKHFIPIPYSELSHPKNNYRYYRRCCLIAREKPYRFIFNLLIKNIKYHLQIKSNIFVTAFNIFKYLAADLLIILYRMIFKSSRYSLLKTKFDNETSRLEKDHLKYILYDE
jgi:glycosyltransferase involved in cell wall biosynthesis